MGVKRTQRMSEAHAANWYDGKDFSSDWTSWHFPNWFSLLKKYRRRKARVLEIGSWEGRSAIFFLNFLPHSQLVCVDTFEGGEEHRTHPEAFAESLPLIEQRFDANTSEFVDRIEKIKARSTDALSMLGVERRRFDLAYIDGGHLATEVYSDAVLTWPLIVRGGIVIFDDYLWDGMPGVYEVPKPGIDAFLGTIDGNYRILLNDYQVAIVKT